MHRFVPLIKMCKNTIAKFFYCNLDYTSQNGKRFHFSLSFDISRHGASKYAAFAGVFVIVGCVLRTPRLSYISNTFVF